MVHTLIEKLFTDDYGNYKFSLSINNIESDQIHDSLHWISSDILPEMMLEKFSPIISPKLIFEQDDSLPDIQYLEELIDFIGELVLKDKDFRRFFYPPFFLDKELNVRTELTRKFNNARKQIRMCEKELFTINDELHLLYFEQLLHIPKQYKKHKNIRIHRITRLAFEKCLTSLLKADAYIEVYYTAERFKVLTNAQKEPRYFLALNKRNEPILAIRAEE
jgi:hypothetical protein